MKTKRLPKFPYVVKDGNASTVIRRYKWHDRRQRRTYSMFRFVCYLQGQRRLFTRSSFERAVRLAQQKLTQMLNGQIAKAQMTEEEAHVFLRARREAQEFDVPLDQIAAEWARWKKLAAGAGGVDPADALRFYALQHGGLKAGTIAEVCDELIAEKRTAARSKRHVGDLEHRCGALKKYAGGMPIAQVTAEHIRQFLTDLRRKAKSFSPRSHNNFLRALGTLFNFAKKRNYLPRDFGELAQVEKITVIDGEIETYQPKELATLLLHASHAEKLFLAIGGFAGIRTKEFIRLEWTDFRFGQGSPVIVINARKAKTASRRVVPILPNLFTWIELSAKSKGKVWPHSGAYLHELLTKTCERAGVPWKPNALRHSFISYRLAQIQNADQVAYEAGNSPSVIHSNYRDLVTPDDAARWFGIEPAGNAQQLALLEATS